MSSEISNVRPAPDKVLTDIADYVAGYRIASAEAYDTARYCLMDTLGCGLEALSYPACTKLMGPIVPGTIVPNGARVPGTQFQLDPVMAAFNIGCMIRWLDFNDTWLAAEWGHPSDNLGGILATADFISRQNVALGRKLEHYQDWHKRRLTAKPGITGLWQVSGRSSVPFDEMVQLDLYYIDHRSTLLDLWIIARTLPVMVKGDGAY